MRTVAYCRGLIAITAACLAVFSIAYGDFAPGGAALPTWIPWREGWVHAFAALVLAAGIALCFSRTSVTGAMALSVYMVVWALISLPQVFSKPLGFDGWYGFCEALTSLVGVWILYAMLQEQSRTSPTPIASERAMRVARILFGLTCMFYGWSHFAYADYTASMVPGWLPGHLALAYLTGIGHVAAGIGIVVGILPRLAATLEAVMMSLFGLLVWVPSFFAQPKPQWATPSQNQWSELVVNVALAAAAWVVTASLSRRSNSTG
jgi:uncharacterized membrane protein YphA (DoxX/SURF4 family)